MGVNDASGAYLVFERMIPHLKIKKLVTGF